MITAVDTNILLDILVPGATYGDASERALTESLETGAVVICEAVYSELAAHFSEHDELKMFLMDTGIVDRPSGIDALYLAGKAWREYLRRRPLAQVCPSCGSTQEFHCTQCGARFVPRQHVLADFMIGAHAVTEADRLLTRDRGYYRTYFPELKLA